MHTKKDETASWWWEQLDLAREVYRDVARTEKHFRPQLHAALNLDLPDMVLGYDPASDSKGNQNPAHVEQINVHYLARYAEWVQSQAFDHHPEILYPRYASPDTTLGDMMGELLVRIGDEAEEMEEWRGVVNDACANGVYAIWYGIDTEASTPEMLYDASKATGDIIEEGMAGVHQAQSGQRHGEVAQIAKDQALGDGTEEGDFEAQVRLLEPGGEEARDRLLDVAAQHEILAEKEEKKPYTDLERNMVWSERLPVGPRTRWDPYCTDNPTARYPRGARWIAREIVMDIDVAREHPAFRPRVRSKIRSGPEKTDDMVQDRASERRESISAHKCSIWEIWDRKYRKRHYVTQGIDEFLEADDTYPYFDAHGYPIIRNFFPVVIRAPRKSANVSPYTPYGIPVCAIAWELQRLVVKLQSYNLDAVKKLAVRQFTYAAEIEDEIEEFTSGQTGVGVKEPAGWGQNNPGRNPINPINFGSVPPELFREIGAAESKMASVLGWPMSQMVGAPQADTATAEQISMQAGVNYISAFIRDLEDAYAKGQEIKRALAKEFYTDDQIAELIGDENVEKWKTWKASSVKGDRLQARFRMSVDPVRIKQVGDMIAQIPTWVDPFTGLPLVPGSEHLRFIQEYTRLNGLGKIEGTKWRDEFLQMKSMEMAGALTGGNGQPEPSGAGKTPPKQSERDEKPASNQQLAGAEQRVGPKFGPGRGLPPPTQ